MNIFYRIVLMLPFRAGKTSSTVNTASVVGVVNKRRFAYHQANRLPVWRFLYKKRLILFTISE